MEEKMSIDPANCTTSEYPYTPRGNIIYLGSDEDKISSASPDKSPNQKFQNNYYTIKKNKKIKHFY